jgi:hypothetical protein
VAREAPPAVEELTPDFMSPFEDELDVPAFLRRRAAQES